MNIIQLPIELHYYLMDMGQEIYEKWPLLSRATASTTRFDENLKKHGKWVKRKKGRLIGVQRFNHGSREGEYIEWNRRGQIRKQCFYKNNKKEGRYKQWNKKGQRHSFCIYKDGKKEGDYKQWRNGVLLFVKTYNYDKIQRITFYYKNGQIWHQTHFKNGLRHGTYSMWHSNGCSIAECNYHEGKIEGKYKRMYNNGKRYVAVYKHGLKHGKYKAWYRHGKKKYEYNYKHGMKDGECKKWRANGYIYMWAVFRKGKLHGEFNLYHGHSYATHVQCYYKDGNRDGPYKRRDIKGRLLCEGIMKEGKREGRWKTWYHEDKIRKTDCFYVSGQLHGTCLKYVSGKLIEELVYSRGEIIKRIDVKNPPSPFDTF